MPHAGEHTDKRSAVTSKVRKINVRVTLLFDGTLNSRRNTAIRQLATNDPTTDRDVADARIPGAHDQGVGKARATFAKYRAKPGEDDGSYESDFSNVARLDAYMGGPRSAPGYDYYIHVYTEGIGTVDDGADSMFGYALGSAGFTGPDTGIIGKVTNGLVAALARITRLRNDAHTVAIGKLTVDTCGFSRGAAAARHCVHRALHGFPEWFGWGDAESKGVKKRLGELGWTVDEVEVCAVGLFDTVASFGISFGGEGGDYAATTAMLHLDAVREAKGGVYQLAAAEEYRLRFSLTTIASAGSKGRQVFLPGAHSDVGGSYVDGQGQNKRLLTGEGSRDVKRFLEARGWCHGNELVYSSAEFSDYVSPMGDYAGPVEVRPESLVTHRPPIRRAYTFIPLQLMAEFLTKWKVPVKGALRTKYDPSGVPLFGYIKEYAEKKQNSAYTDWEENFDPKLQQLRHDYLHLSFSNTSWKNKMGMQLRMVRDKGSPGHPYRPKRYVFPG